MTKQLYGTKLGMTRVFQGDVATPVTVIQVLPNQVVEVKTVAKHGYAALKVACGPERKLKRLKKGVRGEFAKTDVPPRQYLREIPAVEGKEVGRTVTVGEVFVAGTIVDVSAVSKGHGFAGVMKRHNFGGHCTSHGVQKHRGGGSIGCRMDPGKVHKNKRMGGHFGVDMVTIRNLDLIQVDAERHLLLVKGSVPGPRGGLVSVRQA
jgi:large subunit ribosomal protein L3